MFQADNYTEEEEKELQKIKEALNRYLDRNLSRNFTKNPMTFEEISGFGAFQELRTNLALLSSLLNKEKETGRILNLLKEKGVDAKDFKDVCSFLCGKRLSEQDLRDQVMGDDLADKETPIALIKINWDFYRSEIFLRSLDSLQSEILANAGSVEITRREKIDVYSIANRHILDQFKGLPASMIMDEVMRSREAASEKTIKSVKEPIPERVIQILKDFSSKFTEEDYTNTNNVPISQKGNLTAIGAGDEMMDRLTKLRESEPKLYEHLMNLPMYNDNGAYETTLGEAIMDQGGQCGAAFQVKVRKMLFELGVGSKKDLFYVSDLKEEYGAVPRGRHWQWSKSPLNVVSNEAYEQIPKTGIEKAEGAINETVKHFMENGDRWGKLVDRIKELEKEFMSKEKLTEKEFKSIVGSGALHQYVVSNGEHANLLVQDVLGDGNCFYHAISHQLERGNIVVNGGSDHIALRHLAINEIATHPEAYQEFCEDLNNLIEENIHEGAWADHLMIFALANALQVNINIHHGNGSITPIQGGTAGTLNVFYTGSHYMSVLQNSNNSPALSNESKYKDIMDKGKFLRKICQNDHQISMDDIRKLSILLNKKDLSNEILKLESNTLEDLKKLVGQGKMAEIVNVVTEHAKRQLNNKQELISQIGQKKQQNNKKKNDDNCVTM